MPREPRELQRLYYATEFSLKFVALDLKTPEKRRGKFLVVLLKTLITILHLFCIIPNLVYLFKTETNFTSIIEDFTNIGLHVTTLVNFHYYHARSHFLCELYQNVKTTIEEEICEMDKKDLRTINLIRTCIWAFLIGATVACSSEAVFLIYKYVVNGNRSLIFNAYFDWKSSPIYELVFLTQAIAMQNVGIGHYFNDVYYMTIVGLYTLASKHFRYKVRRMEEKSNDVTILKGIVNRHQKYLTLSNKINDFFWPILLYALLMNLFYVVTIPLLILTYWPNNLTKISLMIERTTTSIWQLLIITFVAQTMTNENMKLREAVYSLPWYEFDVNKRKIILTMLIRLYKPIYINVGKYANVTLETFLSIINLAFSFCTVLSNFTRN